MHSFHRPGGFNIVAHANGYANGHGHSKPPPCSYTFYYPGGDTIEFQNVIEFIEEQNHYVLTTEAGIVHFIKRTKYRAFTIKPTQ